MESYTPVFRYPLTESDGWKKLSGELPVRMTNGKTSGGRFTGTF